MHTNRVYHDPMPDDTTLREGRRMLEEQEGDDLDLRAETAEPQPPRSTEPEAGDPPDSVRGSAQELVDPVGEPADDETPRWDPRTVDAPSREGG
jgi:hypothetical protein